MTWEGLPMVTLGVKGLLYVELTCETINRDAHSSYGTVLPNAAWRLVWALSTIKSPDERIQIEGFYDDVRPPTPEERAAVEAMPQEDAETLKQLRDREGADGRDGRRLHRAAPVRADGDDRRAVVGLRGRGAEDGAAGEGDGEDGLPPRAGPGPGRHHGEAARGTSTRTASATSTIKNLGGERPARTPVTDPLVGVMREAIRDAYGSDPFIVPAMAGTGPLYPFVATLGLPTADCGIGYPDAHIHAPDENIRVEDFLRGDEGDCGADWAVWRGRALSGGL